MRLERKILIIIFSLILFSCSANKPVIIEKPIIKEIILPSDTLVSIIIPDTLNAYLLSANFYDSLGKDIATIKANLQSKQATLTLNQKAVTIRDTLIDTVIIKEKQIVEKILPIAIDSLNLTEKMILFGGMGLILTIIIWRRIKL